MLLFTEGFDYYLKDELATYWENHSTYGAYEIRPIGTRHGHGSYLYTHDTRYSSFNIFKYFSTTADIIIIGLAINIVNLDNYHFEIRMISSKDQSSIINPLQFRTNSSIRKAYLQFGGITTPNIIDINRWVHVEFKIFFDPSYGYIEARYEGDVIGRAENINTCGDNVFRNAAGLILNNDLVSYSSSSIKIDDLYVLDNTGTTNNDYLGDVAILSLHPNSNGNQNQWIPSAGNNFECVNTNPFVFPPAFDLYRSAYGPLYNNRFTVIPNNSALSYNASNFSIPITGKWYYEYQIDNVSSTAYEVGISDNANTSYTKLLSSAPGYALKQDGNKTSSSGAESYGLPYVTGDIVGVAYNADTNKIWFSINGVWQNGGDPIAEVNEAYNNIPNVEYNASFTHNSTSDEVTVNFGDSIFVHTVPTGYLPLRDAVGREYVYTSTVGDKEFYNLDDLPPEFNISEILGVELNNLCYKQGLGDFKIQNLIYINSTEYSSGAQKSLSTDMENNQTCLDINPNTGLKFTVTDLNNLQVGFTVSNT